MSTPAAKNVSYDQGCLRSVRKLPDYVSGKFLVSDGSVYG